MNTTTIPAEALEVGTRFGYSGEFTVTAIGTEEDGIFHVRFDHAGTPKSRFMSVGEPIIIPAAKEASPEAVLAAMTPDELLDGYASALRARDRVIRHGITATLRENKEVRAEVDLFRTAILNRLTDATPPF